MQPLIELFSRPPASLRWSRSPDGQRVMGACPGFILDLWPDRVTAVAVFPPDNPAWATRNGMLFALLLAALRPDWHASDVWIADQMRAAADYRATDDAPHYHDAHPTERVRFSWLRNRSQATLWVARE